MTAAELDPEEASKAVAYAQKKVDRAKNFITNMKGKERVALGELRQALEFATMGGADEAMLAEIRELSQSIQEGMEGPNENTNKNTALRARGATAKAAPVARAQTLCDQVFHRPDIVSKVMKFLGWEQRFEMMVLNRHMIETTILNDGHWKWMCSRLDECGLYAPNGIPAGTTWKALFEEIYPMRKLFDEPPAAPFETETVRNLRLLREGREEEIQEPGEESEVGAAEATSKPDYKFNIQVCARMRPAPPGTHDSTKVGGGDQGVAMVLPLHQRLKLIQASHKCSKKEARRILWEGRGSNDPWATARCLEEEELREAAAAAAAAAAANLSDDDESDDDSQGHPTLDGLEIRPEDDPLGLFSRDPSTLTPEEQRLLKKQRRLLKNRESAQLSRHRKKMHLNALEKQVEALKRDKAALAQKVQALHDDNERLRKQLISA